MYGRIYSQRKFTLIIFPYFEENVFLYFSAFWYSIQRHIQNLAKHLSRPVYIFLSLDRLSDRNNVTTGRVNKTLWLLKQFGATVPS